VLPVLGSEEAEEHLSLFARGILRKLEGQTGYGRGHVSALNGLLAHVERVALDAPPRTVAGGTTDLVSPSREELYRST
jgi:hypothetical protein